MTSKDWDWWRCCTWTATSSGSIELKCSNQQSSGKNSLFQSRYDQEQGKCINFYNLLSRKALAYFQNGHRARLERRLRTRARECLRTSKNNNNPRNGSNIATFDPWLGRTLVSNKRILKIGFLTEFYVLSVSRVLLTTQMIWNVRQVQLISSRIMFYSRWNSFLWAVITRNVWFLSNVLLLDR